MSTTRCDICGEKFRNDGSGSDAQAEMHDPPTTGPSAIVHAECGLVRGWEVA